MYTNAKKIAEAVSFEEYLAMEEKATFKSEYHNGKVFAMSGGTLEHSQISLNIGSSVRGILKDKKSKCRVFESNAKVFAESFNRGVYPDISVVCEAPNYYQNRKDVYTNPILIIEVLSETTKDYDKGEKFEIYRSLPSFREYVLVHQDQIKVQTWFKQEENLWRISTASSLQESIQLHSLNIEVQLEDVYYQIEGLADK